MVRLVRLYHGTRVDYHKLLAEGLRPLSRKEIVDEALSTVERVLGYLPEGAHSTAVKAAAYYRQRYRAGLYFSSFKEVAMFYAPIGGGGEAITEVAREVLRAHTKQTMTLEEIKERAVGDILCYVVSVEIPVAWVMSGLRGVSDEEVRRRLLGGVGVSEVRTKNVVPPDMIIEVEEFQYIMPRYEKVQCDSGFAYRQVGTSSTTPLVSVWRRG